MKINELFDELSRLEEVEAIALGGSRASGACDEKSDYDVYLYCTKKIPDPKRAEILSRYCRYAEIGNSFWEYEDNATLNDGVDIDILYRDLDEFGAGISRVVDECVASNGYTTCMWHNLVTCKILYDRDGRLTALKNKYTVPYPAALKANIVDRNMKLLCRALPAYETQIKKAVLRGDKVSVNHRVAEFLASYFDVIFALNELTHPGEKRLVALCEAKCKILPVGFAENIDKLFADMFTHPESVAADVSKIVTELEAVIDR